MTKQTISELKNLLETAINQELIEFKSMAARYNLMTNELDLLLSLLVEKAQQLKEVEYLIRANGDTTYPALVDDILHTTKPKKGTNGR